MKTKRIISLLLTGIVGVGLTAQSYNLSLKNSLFYKNLNVKESVFENGDYLSTLEWSQPLNLANDFQICLSYQKLIFSVDIATGIPLKSGNMKDFDYLTTTSGVISNYSEHDLYLDKFYSLGINLSYSFEIGDFSITPGTGFSYENQKFSAQDGFLQYPEVSGTPWTGDEKKDYLNGNIISYEQAVYYPYLSLTVDYNFLENMNCGITGELRAFGKAHAVDSHYLRSKQFYDYFSDGLGFGIGTYCSYGFNRNLIQLDIGYDYFMAKGETADNKIGKTSDTFIKTDDLTSQIENKSLYIRIGFEFYPFE